MRCFMYRGPFYESIVMTCVNPISLNVEEIICLFYFGFPSFPSFLSASHHLFLIVLFIFYGDYFLPFISHIIHFTHETFMNEF
jgi:hypothetical protein